VQLPGETMTIEHARQIAAQERPKTTRLYDRTIDPITLDEVERIVIGFSVRQLMKAFRKTSPAGNKTITASSRLIFHDG
jgi:hypothetical protein